MDAILFIVKGCGKISGMNEKRSLIYSLLEIFEMAKQFYCRRL